LADLLEAARWIAQDRPTAALRLQEAVRSLATSLGEHPLVGQARPEIAEGPLRFAVVRGFPYLVLYDPTLTPPLILRLLHGARDLPEVLKAFRDSDLA
jgi:toxin ParE1/3/4